MIINRIVKCFMLVCLPLYFLSCNKVDEYEGESTHVPVNRKLQVTVKHVYQLNPYKDSVVHSAKVLIYDTFDDLQYENPPIRDLKTDSTGVVLAEYLPSNYQYIRIDHPELGERIDSVSTPSKAVITYLEVNYWP